MSNLPDRDTLGALLKYDEASGLLFWRERGPEWFQGNARFAPDAAARMWNGRNAGKRAFGRINAKGYHVGCLLGHPHIAHRVIWKMLTGEDPQTIDHINGCGTDNRAANLRSVSMSEQARNKPLYSTNTTGVSGVTHCRGKWKSTIWRDGTSRHLGIFESKADAIAARKGAEARFGYHANHGRTNRG